MTSCSTCWECRRRDATLKVAVERGRHAIGIELNPEYVALTEQRLSGVTPPLISTEMLA